MDREERAAIRAAIRAARKDRANSAKRHRKALGLHREGLAKRMALSKKSGATTVAQWENGDRNMSDMAEEFLRTLVKYEAIDVDAMKNK